MNPTDRRVIAVFGSSQSQPGSREYEDGVRCGRLLAEAGFAVATGGYGGLMEAVCRGAAEVGGPSVGVTAPTVFPGRSGANRWVQYELPADDLVRRIAQMADLSSGYIALPGSIGTLAELVVAATERTTRQRSIIHRHVLDRRRSRVTHRNRVGLSSPVCDRRSVGMRELRTRDA